MRKLRAILTAVALTAVAVPAIQEWDGTPNAYAATIGHMQDLSVRGAPYVMGTGNYYEATLNTGTGWVVFTAYPYDTGPAEQPFVCLRNWNGRTANYVGANSGTYWTARATGGGCGTSEQWDYACGNTAAILWLRYDPGAGYLVDQGGALVMGIAKGLGRYAADSFYIDGICDRP